MSGEFLVRLVDVRVTTAEGETLELARNMPLYEFDREGEYSEVDIAPLFGGGVEARAGAEIELRVRWVRAPAYEDDE